MFWVDLTFECYEDVMVFVFSFLFFLFRTDASKRYLNESNFLHSYANFFESAILKITWPQLYSKLLLNNSERHWQQHFERHPAVEEFTDMGQDTC